MKWLTVCATAMALLAPTYASGSTLAATATILGSAADFSAFTTGWAFNTTRPLTVTGLGYYDHAGDGLQSSHEVGIFTSGGILRVSAWVPAGTAGTLVGQWRVAAISDYVLLPGAYVIGGASIFSADRGIFALTGVSSIDGLTVTALDRFGMGGSLTFPGLFATSSDYLSPNFTVADVPEPSTMALVLIGGVAVAVFRRRQARSSTVRSTSASVR